MTRRSDIGLAMKAAQQWERSLTWAAVMAILASWQGKWDDKAQATLNQYQEFLGRIREMNLPDAIQEPRLLNVSVIVVKALIAGCANTASA
jgi:tRNA nucleotidyltransferase (CCA-adding enzyme)